MNSTSQRDKSEIIKTQIDSSKITNDYSTDTIKITSLKNEFEPQKAALNKETNVQHNISRVKVEPNGDHLAAPDISVESEKKTIQKEVLVQLEKNQIASDKKPTLNLEDWDNLLQKFVSPGGQVNYKSLKKNEDDLKIALNHFVTNIPDEKWSRSEKLAYWINTYNAFTLKLIVDNYPLKKITDLDGGKTWDVKRIELGRKWYSLNQIENEIIRPQFKDARIHFAINCGAKSCPPLFNHAFVPEKLGDQLESRTRSFIRDEKFNQISIDNLKLSQIFNWYAADFGDIKIFLKKYSNSNIPDLPLKFNDYDWTLNE